VGRERDLSRVDGCVSGEQLGVRDALHCVVEQPVSPTGDQGMKALHAGVDAVGVVVQESVDLDELLHLVLGD
jgi:hypothetical protein